MNPFLYDPVATPLAARPTNGWRRVFPNRRYRAAAAAAGLSMVFSAQAMDVNTASITELQTLRGLGPRTAQIIVQERDRAGKFESLQDLSDRVKGLGQKRLQSLQAAGLMVGSGVSSAVGSVDQATLKSARKGGQSNKSTLGLQQASAIPLMEALP
ncbi:competence protein ComEA [Jezberella montanilacus]|uniref:Competence protein ComEA n=1 Tax=Jezberella montanilacus TaxID=323426 RepID=A0A2T0XK08_9BURK|nr:helix-hairpin-helix domain-containing protein [Jezberella montanilacus]PRY99299.1 competence protein ComEA [Jezberella montanilacus]|eukprot:gene533-535_t